MKQAHHHLLPGLFLAATLGGACRSTVAVPAEPSSLSPAAIVLASVDGQPLTLKRAMDDFLSAHGGGHEVLVRGEPAVRELTGRLVEQELFLDEARSLGVLDDESFRANVEEYRGGTVEIAFWRKQVEERVSVPDEEVEAFYDKTDVALALSIVEARTREEAEALRARVEGGEDLAELASKESIHSSRSFGGALSYVLRGDLEPSLEEAAFALTEPGSLTPVVSMTDGWAFLRLEQRTTNTDRPPREKMLPRIRDILEDRREDELRAAVEEEVYAKADIQLIEPLLTREVLLGEESGEAIVARSAGETLTLAQLRDFLNLEAIADASAEQVDPAIRGLVEGWAHKRAARMAGRALGLYEDPDVIAKVNRYEREAALSTLYTEYVYADLDLSEERVRAYYDAHEHESFVEPPEIRLAYVVAATEADAAALRERAEAGESLEDLAHQSSIDPASAMTGGRAQWLRPGQILEPVEKVAFSLAPGELAGPVETEVGWFVLQVYERKEERPVPYDRARRAALQRLAKEEQKEAYAVWAERLRERADIALHEDGIRAAVAWLDAKAEAEAAAKLAETPAPDLLGPPLPPQGPPGHGAH